MFIVWCAIMFSFNELNVSYVNVINVKLLEILLSKSFILLTVSNFKRRKKCLMRDTQTPKCVHICDTDTNLLE